MALLLHAPASVGDVLDRLTILALKRERVRDPGRRANVERELEALALVWAAPLGDWRADPDTDALTAVNTALWEVEDDLRSREAAGDFGPEFVEAARSVYRLNDRRAALKRRVNNRLGSALIEEKQHPTYGGRPE